MMKNFLDKMNEEINREEYQRVDEVSLQGIGQGIKAGIQKVVDWAKETFTKTLKTVGYGIAYLTNGKFNLFDKKGKKILPKDMGKISTDGKTIQMESVDGQHQLRMYYTSQGEFTAVKKNPKFGAAVFNFRVPTTKAESKELALIDNQLNEATGLARKTTMAGMASDTDKDFKKQSSRRFTSHVDYKGFIDAIDNTIADMKYAPTSLPQVIAVVGDSGIGKTQIIEHTAQEQEFNFFYMELGKVDKSLITGIPFISSSYNEKSGKEETGIKLAGAQGVFPSIREMYDSIPPGSKEHKFRGPDRNWIVFFDEFNRARTEVTSVIMNLLLTGKLTTAIKMKYNPETGELEPPEGGEGVIAEFPGRPIVLLGMNEKNQQNIEAATQKVYDLDIATVSRLVTVYKLVPTVPGWEENFAALPGTQKFNDGTELILYPRVPVAILSYLESQVMKAREEGRDDADAAPFNLVRRAGGNDASAIDPRSWASIGDKYYKNAYKEWQTLSDEQKYSDEVMNLAQQYLDDLERQIQDTEAEGPATLAADRSIKRMKRAFDKLKGMDEQEAAKQLAFTAWANSNWTRIAKFLNTQDIAASFGLGQPGGALSGSGDKTGAQEVEEMHRDIINHIVQTRSEFIDPNQLFLNYLSVEKNEKSQLTKKVREAFFVKEEDGSYTPKFQAYELGESFGLFLAQYGIGSEKQVMQLGDTEMNGNIKVSIDILDGMGVKGDNASKADVEVSDKTKKYLKTISSAKEPAKKGEAIIKAALAQIIENLAAMFSDFSKSSSDVMDSINAILNRFKSSGFNKNTGNIYFDTPFAELIQLHLKDDERFRNVVSGKTKSMSKDQAFSDMGEDVDRGMKELFGKLLKG